MIRWFGLLGLGNRSGGDSATLPSISTHPWRRAQTVLAADSCLVLDPVNTCYTSGSIFWRLPSMRQSLENPSAIIMKTDEESAVFIFISAVWNMLELHFRISLSSTHELPKYKTLWSLCSSDILFATFFLGLFVVMLAYHFQTCISYQPLLRLVPTFNASSSLSPHSFHSLGMTSITLLSEINAHSVRDKLMSRPDCFLPAVPWESPGWKTPEVRSSSRPEDALPAGSFLNRAESCWSGGLLCDLGKSCRSESFLIVL